MVLRAVWDFFSLIPPRCWMMRKGGPVIFLYSATFAAGQDPKAILYLKRRFREDFAFKRWSPRTCRRRLECWLC